MTLIGHLRILPTQPPPPPPPPHPTSKTLLQNHKSSSTCLQITNPTNCTSHLLLSLALTVSLTTSPSPSLAVPFNNSQSLGSFPPTTPYSQSKNLQVGLLDGKIRPCPSTNPGCVSTNPKSSSFAFPLRIPESSTDNAIQQLQNAILESQRNVQIQVIEDTPFGQYLRAEVDGGFGRDVLEFLVRGDVVSYRSVATKVTYVYPFTTAIGDSKGQEERVKRIIDQLGWYSPSFDFMD